MHYWLYFQYSPDISTLTVCNGLQALSISNLLTAFFWHLLLQPSHVRSKIDSATTSQNLYCVSFLVLALMFFKHRLFFHTYRPYSIPCLIYTLYYILHNWNETSAQMYSASNYFIFERKLIFERHKFWFFIKCSNYITLRHKQSGLNMRFCCYFT